MIGYVEQRREGRTLPFPPFDPAGAKSGAKLDDYARHSAHRSPLARERTDKPRFAFILLPNFTLTPLSSFIDMLRLIADEGDRSKPVRCEWTIVGTRTSPVRSSCGLEVSPSKTFDDARQYDYVIVVGGLLHAGPQLDDATRQFLQDADAAGVTLVGICTGTFALVAANVMENRRCCVSWYHYWDFIETFPAKAAQVVADRRILIDNRRITCSGGQAAVDVAAAVLERHFDAATVRKALSILIVDDLPRTSAPQPVPPGLQRVEHPQLRRAITIMEQHLSDPLPVAGIAEQVGLSVRQLERLFVSETGMPPAAYSRRLCLESAVWMLRHTGRSITQIANESGFVGASHLGRAIREKFGLTPSQIRASREAPPPESGNVDYAELFPNSRRFG